MYHKDYWQFFDIIIMKLNIKYATYYFMKECDTKSIMYVLPI